MKDCLEALDQTLGSTESSEDIYYKFLNVHQQRGKNVSAYIQKSEKLPQRAVRKGILSK